MNGIGCGIAGDLLPLYVEDLLSPESVQAVQAHLAVCGECRDRYRAMQGECTPEPEKICRQTQDARLLRRFRGKLIAAIATAVIWVPVLLALCAVALALYVTVWALCAVVWCLPLACLALLAGAVWELIGGSLSGSSAALALGLALAALGLGALLVLLALRITKAWIRLTARLIQAGKRAWQRLTRRKEETV